MESRTFIMAILDKAEETVIADIELINNIYQYRVTFPKNTGLKFLTSRSSPPLYRRSKTMTAR